MRFRLIYSLLFLAGLALLTAGALASNDEQIDPFTDQVCLDCHSDQSRLTELAVVPEEPEEEPLSEGPG